MSLKGQKTTTTSMDWEDFKSPKVSGIWDLEKSKFKRLIQIPF